MNKEFFFIILKRFGKAFFWGGISSSLVVLGSSPLVNVTDWRPWLAALITAFLTGGLMALEKMLQGWNP